MIILFNKRLLTACLLCVSLSMYAQTSKWFVTFTVGYQLAGPSGSIKKSQTENRYNVPETIVFFSSGPQTFPYVSHSLSLLGMVGKKISNRASVYLLFGLPGAAEVHGYDGRFGNNIKYQVYQFTAGYQLSFSNSRSKIGAGPTIFFLQSGKNNHDQPGNKITDNHSAVKPGVSFMGRVPFGKGRKLVGLELFGQLNVSSRATFEDYNSYYNRSEAYNMNMVEGVIGLSVALSENRKSKL
ncbi:MAG: hypothetical protein ACTHNG_16145 [Ginsengibacter sp.]